MEPNKTIDEYLQEEIISIPDGYDKGYFIDVLVTLTNQQKVELVRLVDEMKRLGISEPIVWALQDVVNGDDDKGGTANIAFTTGLLKLADKMPEIAEELREERYIELFKVLDTKPEQVKDFLQSLGFLFIQYVTDHIVQGNTRSEILRSWKLFSIHKDGKAGAEISSIDLFI